MNLRDCVFVTPMTDRRIAERMKSLEALTPQQAFAKLNAQWPPMEQRTWKSRMSKGAKS